MTKYVLVNKFEDVITITQEDPGDAETGLPIKVKAKTAKIRKAVEVDVYSTPNPYGKPLGLKPSITDLSYAIKYMTLQKGYKLADKEESVKPLINEVDDDRF